MPLKLLHTAVGKFSVRTSSPVGQSLCQHPAHVEGSEVKAAGRVCVRAFVRACVRARVFKPSAEAYLIGRLVVGGGAELSEAAGSSCAAASVGHTPQFLRLGGCEALD